MNMMSYHCHEGSDYVIWQKVKTLKMELRSKAVDFESIHQEMVLGEPALIRWLLEWDEKQQVPHPQPGNKQAACYEGDHVAGNSGQPLDSEGLSPAIARNRVSPTHGLRKNSGPRRDIALAGTLISAWWHPEQRAQPSPPRLSKQENYQITGLRFFKPPICGILLHGSRKLIQDITNSLCFCLSLHASIYLSITQVHPG